jgi:hypothetical protein
MMITSLTEIIVRSKHEVFEILRKGNFRFFANEFDFNFMEIGLRHREISTFGMHKGSNRSHIVFSLTVEQTFFASSITKVSKLTFVDLAGSERIARTPSDGRHVTEAIKINESLAVLIKVIGSLTDESFGGHVPYRESKLTHYLKHSFGGNSKTILLLAITSTTSSARETLATLRLGMSSKRVENKVSMNEEATIPRESSSTAIYKELQTFIEAQNMTIQALQSQLKGHQAQSNREVELEQLLTKAQKTLETQSKVIKTLHDNIKDLRGQLLEKEELLTTVLAREQMLIETINIPKPVATAVMPTPVLVIEHEEESLISAVIDHTSEVDDDGYTAFTTNTAGEDKMLEEEDEEADEQHGESVHVEGNIVSSDNIP